MSDAEVRALLRDYEASGDSSLLDQALRVAQRSGLPLPVEQLDAALHPSRSFESSLKFKVWALVPSTIHEPDQEQEKVKSTRMMPSFSWLSAIPLGETPGVVEVPEHAMFWVEPIGTLGKRLPEVLQAVRDQDADGVSLDGSRVKDEMLEPLAEHNSLRYLSLQECHNVTGSGLRHLPPSLRALALGQCKRIKNEGLRELGRLPLLTWLDLSGSSYTGDCLGDLAALPLLTRLNIRWFKSCGSRHIPALVPAPNLRRLTTGGSTSLGTIASLKDLASLTHLDFMGSRLSDKGLNHLARIKPLRHLKLSPSFDAGGISPAGLARLAEKLPALQSLDLRPDWWEFRREKWGWDKGGLEELRAALPVRVELRP